MTTPTITHRVDSLHINVGAGDSAIHLLVDPQAMVNGKPTVKRACLIDGGKSVNGRDQDIQYTINKLKVKYHLSSDHEPGESDEIMRFDSVVITHWDDDHFGGIVELLQWDFEKQWEEGKPHDLADPVTCPKPYVQQFRDTMEHRQCRYFRYGGLEGSSLETTLYAPYWHGSARTNLEKKDDKNQAGSRAREFGESVHQDGEKTLTFEMVMMVDLKPRNKKLKAIANIGNLCKLCYEPDEMMGVNFFNNHRLLSPPRYADIKDPDMLKDLVGGTDSAPVGMYCVACRARVIGSDKFFNDKPEKEVSGIELFLEESETKSPNKLSIGAIILWREPFKITHYFAGDAWWPAEEELATWIGKSKKISEVPCMKLSHHGALNSTPQKMLDIFKPDNIVISAGEKHGHPMWSLLLYLNAWLLHNKKTRAVFATCYPYYCAKEYDDYKDESCKQFVEEPKKGEQEKPSKERLAFWADLEKLYESLGVKGLQKQAHDWRKEIIDKNEAKGDIHNYTAWVTWQVQNAWVNNLSAMYDHQIPPFEPPEDEDILKSNFILIQSALEHPTRKIKISVGVDLRKPDSFVSYHDAAERNAGEPLIRSQEVARKTLPELCKDIPTDKLIKQTKSPSSSKYCIKDDAQHLGTSNENYDRTKSLSTGKEYWFRPDKINDPCLNRFLSQLHYSEFGISGKPENNSQTDFLVNDGWNCWFADALASNSLKLSTDSKAAPSGFLFEMAAPFTTATRLKFKTRHPQESLPTLGIIRDTNIMVFDLDSRDSKVETTLPEILSYIRLKVLENSPLVKAFGDNLKLRLSTEPEAVNAIWFDPGLAYRTTLRLQWEIDNNPLSNFLESAGINFEVQKVLVITTRVTSWRPDLTMIPRGKLRLDVTVKVLSADWLGTITAEEDSFGLAITAEKCSWTKFLGWLVHSLGLGPPDISQISENDSPLSSVIILFSTTIVPRRMSFEVRQVSEQKSKSWSVSFEIVIKSVAFLVTYYSATKLLRGHLWLDPGDVGVRKLLPGWEENDFLRPSPGAKSELDLADLIPNDAMSTIPAGIPTKLREASVTIDPKSITFFASLVCETPEEKETTPTIALGTVELNVRYLFQGTDRLSFEFYCNATLGRRNANDEDDDDDGNDDDEYGATLEGVLTFDEGAWTLSGTINGLNFSSIYSLLDPDAPEDVLSVLEKLELSNLELLYEYGGRNGTRFLLVGSLMLGKLELAMTYTYNSHGWSLTAELGSSKAIETLGTIVSSIVDLGDGILPDCIANIPIAGGADGDKLVTIHCSKAAKIEHPKDRKNYYILFKATLKIPVSRKTSVEVTFAQYRDLASDKKDPAKRVLQLSLLGLPTVSVPTLGELPQPFDEMLYLWVQDKTTQANKNNTAGLTQQEVEYINRGVPNANAEQAHSPRDWLFYRDTRKPETRKPTDFVIGAGSHFMIMLNAQNQRQAILDYVFQAEPKPKRKSLEKTSYSDTIGSGGKGNSAKAAYQKTAGPISISNIGLKYDKNVLSVLVDASFVLGPVGFTFLGAAIKINLEGKNILELTLENVSFDLAGLTVAFDRPPLRLAGMFTHGKATGMTYYAGGIVVGFDPYQFRAAGMYGEVSKPKDFKTAFVYAKLEGPLVTLAFAEISGITGGFGYNSEVTKPTVETVRNFPFIESKEIADDLLGALEDLVGVDGSGAFTIRNGSMWLAAGLKVSAFKMLAIDAVIVISWNTSVAIDVCGVAVADIPKGSKAPFAHIELGILATLDFGAGVFKVEAQLAPSSYVFDSSCRLTGGFALYYWFNDRASDLEGDWVFTVGGYHRAFDKPAHYPNPPRLGISWQVSKDISILGEAYFAITPKCCMAGGRLRATLSTGPLTAWFATWADFLIKYQPFYFWAEAAVSIGISCKIDLLITSFTISVEVGATLLLEGPPLHGQVHINFWVSSFDISFGPDAESPTPPNLEQFYEMVLQSEDQQSLAAMIVAPTTEPVPTATKKRDHVFSCRGGLIERKGKQTVTEPNESWGVKMGSFVFAIDVRFVLSEAVIEPPKEFGPNTKLDPLKFSSTEKIYAKPMENDTVISSILTVTIEPQQAIALTAEPDKTSIHNWQVIGIWKEVPSALWGKYDNTKDPIRPGSDLNSLLDKNKGTISRLMGLEIRPPNPELANDKIGKFDAIKAMEQGVFTKNEIPNIPRFADQSTDWTASDDGSTTPADRYKRVKEIWETRNEDQRKAITDALAEGLAWREKLTAATPLRLVDDLGNRYMSAPMISLG